MLLNVINRYIFMALEHLLLYQRKLPRKRGMFLLLSLGRSLKKSVRFRLMIFLLFFVRKINVLRSTHVTHVRKGFHILYVLHTLSTTHFEGVLFDSFFPNKVVYIIITGNGNLYIYIFAQKCTHFYFGIDCWL